MVTLNKIALILILATTTVGASNRNADVMGIVAQTNATHIACEAEGHTERYCEWRYNFDHWPKYPMYHTFPEYLELVRLPKYIIREELEKNGVYAR